MYKLDTASSIPLYQQIVDQTKVAIATGVFKEGDMLPSIREMAKTLLINTSTVSRAYRELETSGYIETRSGRGTFVSFDQDRLELEKGNAWKNLESALKEAMMYDLSEDELIELYREIKGGVKDDAEG